MPGTKTFVLDASVLLHDPLSIYQFDDNRVIIPEASIEQLNNCKRAKNELGNNAREILNILDELSKNTGSLVNGIDLGNGFLKIELDHPGEKLDLQLTAHGQLVRVLKICKYLETLTDNPVIMVSKDVFSRVLANTLQIEAQDYKHDQVPDKQYTGRAALLLGKSSVESYLTKGSLEVPADVQLHRNQFVELKVKDHSSIMALGRFDGDRIIKLRYMERPMFEALPRTPGQEFYRECLLAPPSEAPLVIAKGPAGTAKTFLALAAGLEQTYTATPLYRKILFCRPNVHLDEAIGFLPGTEEEKIYPLMRGLIDNLEVLLDKRDFDAMANATQKQRLRAERDLKANVKSLFDEGYITSEAVAYLRGRSIQYQFIIVDEAQNLTPGQAKAILSRAASNTKIILCGDPEQIDHPFLDYRTNGLSYASEKLKDSKLCWQVTFGDEECERSPLAHEIGMKL